MVEFGAGLGARRSAADPGPKSPTSRRTPLGRSSVGAEPLPTELRSGGREPMRWGRGLNQSDIRPRFIAAPPAAPLRRRLPPGVEEASARPLSEAQKRLRRSDRRLWDRSLANAARRPPLPRRLYRETLATTCPEVHPPKRGRRNTATVATSRAMLLYPLHRRSPTGSERSPTLPLPSVSPPLPLSFSQQSYRPHPHCRLVPEYLSLVPPPL